jgi:uncharacterized protein (TIGR03067 family)
MALLQCPECGRQISDRATACPQCGLPIRYPPKEEPGPPKGTPPRYDDDLPPRRPRNKARHSNTGLIIGLSVGGGVLGVGLIILIIVLATGGRQSDHDLIQGKWKAGNNFKGLEFTGETVWQLSPNGERRSPATYKLDPSKNPKTIDITIGSGSEKGRTLLGIYALEGDTLTICVNERFRPTELKDGPGTDLIVLKREKR